MKQPLTISARNAGQVELEKYCPRCCWYLLRIKKMPFAFGMPGIMFYMERAEQYFITTYMNSQSVSTTDTTHGAERLQARTT